MASVESLLCSLETLSLGTQIPKPKPERRKWERTFTQFLHSCWNLQRMQLRFDCDNDVEDEEDDWGPPDMDLAEVGSWPAFVKLRDLQLSELVTTAHGLASFLRKQQPSLHSFELVEGAFERDGDGDIFDDWRVVLEPLLDLNLGHLFVVVHDDSQWFLPLEAEGQDVKAALRKALVEGPPVPGQNDKHGLFYLDWQGHGVSDSESDQAATEDSSETESTDEDD